MGPRRHSLTAVNASAAVWYSSFAACLTTPGQRLRERTGDSELPRKLQAEATYPNTFNASVRYIALTTREGNIATLKRRTGYKENNPLGTAKCGLRRITKYFP